MLTFALRRLFTAMVLTTAVLALVHALVFLVGDPATATLGANASPAAVQDFREREGLDKPLWMQLTSYFGVTPCLRRSSARFGGYCGLVQGDLGESYSHHEPVTTIISDRLPRTLLLGALALLFELAFGLAIGTVAALRQHRPSDAAWMAVAFFGISLPTFVTGPFFLDIFAFRMGLFPLGGYGNGSTDHLLHAILPALTLSILGGATYARLWRGELCGELTRDYVRTARAKGMPVHRVLLHAARTAFVPVVALIGLSFPTLVSGAIITESIFGWPGMGTLALEAVTSLDAPTVMGVVAVFALTVQLGNFLADVVTAWLDPRVRTES